jgi:hypothetical protein
MMGAALVLGSISIITGHATAAGTVSAWTTSDQLGVPNVDQVVVSPDARWAAVSTGGMLHLHGPGSATAISTLCAAGGGSCSAPAFDRTSGDLAFMCNGSLYTSTPASGRWGQPRLVHTGGATPLHFEWGSGGKIAYTAAVSTAHSATEPRVLEDDVIIAVIQGTPSALRNELCIATTDGQPPVCLPESAVGGSVGMAPWTISCWPYDSQFAWSPSKQQPSLLAITTTNTTRANDWCARAAPTWSIVEAARACGDTCMWIAARRESLQIHLLDTSTHPPKRSSVTAPGAVGFQPTFSPDGALLAYTLSDYRANGDYTWAQTWSICVVPVR